MDYFTIYIEPKDSAHICAIIDQFYESRSAMVGELMTQGIVILEEYYQKTAIVPEQAPTKFLSRLRKYRIDFAPQYRELIAKLNSTTEGVEIPIESETVTEIKTQIHNVTDFTTPALQLDQFLQEEHLFEQTLGIAEEEFNDQKKKILLNYRLIQKELEIPEKEFESITEYMMCFQLQNSKKKKRPIKGYHTATMVMIIALWQLLHYEQGSYVSENSIEKLNNRLRTILRLHQGRKGMITSKSIELAELEILKGMYVNNIRNTNQKTATQEMIYS